MQRKTFIKTISMASVATGMGSLYQLDVWSSSLENTPKMPVLFLGHGSPMNAIEENEFVTGFRNITDRIPTPKAILCISAHWYTKGTKVSAMEMPRTIHDFDGFPKELFDVQYPSKGSPSLAEETVNLLQPVEVSLDYQWGLDHGAWSVIKHLYPKADIPVIEMSIDYTKSPAFHFELASRLATLRRKGILIIGSGNIVHNLGLVDWPNFDKDDHGFDWAIEARYKTNSWLKEGNFSALLDYEKQGRFMQLAVPSPDHYLPLIYSVGLKDDKDDLKLFNDKLMAGSLSMTSVYIG